MRVNFSYCSDIYPYMMVSVDLESVPQVGDLVDIFDRHLIVRSVLWRVPNDDEKETQVEIELTNRRRD